MESDKEGVMAERLKPGLTKISLLFSKDHLPSYQNYHEPQVVDFSFVQQCMSTAKFCFSDSFSMLSADHPFHFCRYSLSLDMLNSVKNKTNPFKLLTTH